MVRGILFDKDGTLLQFEALWGEATRKVLPQFLRALSVPPEAGLCDDLLQALGVHGSQVEADKALAWMSYPEIAHVLVKRIFQHGFSVQEEGSGALLTELYEREVIRPEANIVPTCDLVHVMKCLKRKKCRIGLATADSENASKYCLDRLGIRNYFDYIGTSGGAVRPKPARDLCDRFCEKLGLLPEEVAVVGDSPTDMVFAHNSGATAVAVLTGVGSRETLSDTADIVISSAEELIQLV